MWTDLNVGWGFARCLYFGVGGWIQSAINFLPWWPVKPSLSYASDCSHQELAGFFPFCWCKWSPCVWMQNSDYLKAQPQSWWCYFVVKHQLFYAECAYPDTIKLAWNRCWHTHRPRKHERRKAPSKWPLIYCCLNIFPDPRVFSVTRCEATNIAAYNTQWGVRQGWKLKQCHACLLNAWI